MSSPVHILLATQRSGTNMLRKIIATDERVHCLPEVFNNSYNGRSDFPEGIPYYLEFLENAVREDATKCHPDVAYDLVGDYFGIIARRMESDERVALVDVKYNSLNHADATWRQPGKRPEMLRLFKSNNYPVIHLRRRNLVRLAFSLTRALQSNQYVARRDHDVSKISIDLDVPFFVKWVQELKINEEMVRKWLKLVGAKRLELCYEDLFEEHPGSPFLSEPFERIAEFLGLGEMRFDLVPKTRKLAPQDLREEINNFDELEAALKGTEFEEFLYAP